MALEKKFTGSAVEEALKDVGINVASLKANERVWEQIEAGLKTDMITLTVKLKNVDREIPMAARIHLYENKDGKLDIFIHSVRNRIDVGQHKGHEFTKAEQSQLFNNAQLDHPVLLKLGDRLESCLVGIDKGTN